jgi:ATP-binding cassette subfamily C protein
MFKYIIKHKWYIVFLVALMIFEPTLNAVLNFLLQKMFNSATVGTEKLLILRFLILGFTIWISKRLMSFGISVIKSKFVCNAKHDIKHDIFCNTLNLNTSVVRSRASSGEYLSVFTNDINILEQKYFDGLFDLISGIFALVILATSFVMLNVKIAVAILSFGLITMFVPTVFRNILSSKNLFYSNNLSHFSQKIKEYFESYATIKNYSIEGQIIRQFNGINRNTENSKFGYDTSLALANNVGSMLSWFMQFMGIGLGLILVIRGEILIGTVISAQSFANDLAYPLQNIVFSLNSLKSVKKIVAKFNKLSQKETESDSDALPSTKLPTTFDVKFENLKVHTSENKILDGIDFTFNEGKKYLIVGKNGAGKSSMFKALKKQLKITDGNIFIGDVSVFDLSNKDISNYVSYLNENVSLFSGTVKDNITLSMEYSEEELQKAVKNAQMNLNIDREINDCGTNISSGEQRRIEIARSILRNVKVLIFDEVVSTLDVVTAYEIEKMILEYSDKTVIFISHNFSGKLIKNYDEILVVGDGKIVNHGTFEHLYNTCEYFKEICDIKIGNLAN